MQYFARGSFWVVFSSKNASKKKAFCCQTPCRAKREALHGNFITAPRAQLLSLYDKEWIIAGQWSAHPVSTLLTQLAHKG